MQNLHYIWTDMEADHPLPLIDRRRVFGSQVMLANVFLHQGFKVASHKHENEQFACVLSGRVLFGLGEPASSEYREVTVLGGEVLHLPSNLPHSAEALEDSQLLDVFSPPSERTGVDG